jgi:hypothetical protein
MVSPSREPAYSNAYHRQYYLKNKERRRAIIDAYQHIPENYYKSKYYSLSKRAEKANLEFALTVEDIIELCAASKCPLLGIPLRVAHESQGKGLQPNAPSIDRVDSTKGYTKDNVWVISHRANTIKNSATWQELYQIALNLKTKIESIEDEQTAKEAEHPPEQHVVLD